MVYFPLGDGKFKLFRIFDDDEDGRIYAADMVEVLTSFGEKFSKSEARKLVQNEDNTGEGLIDYEGKILILKGYFILINIVSQNCVPN